MFADGYLPTDPDCLLRLGVQPLDLRVRVIGARHLLGARNRRGLVSPFVEVEVVGADYDHVRHRTKVIPDNGLNPVWDEAFAIKILNPAMALIRFVYIKRLFVHSLIITVGLGSDWMKLDNDVADNLVI
jgi:phosphatidylinositol phospholipase C gamma-1